VRPQAYFQETHQGMIIGLGYQDRQRQSPRRLTAQDGPDLLLVLEQRSPWPQSLTQPRQPVFIPRTRGTNLSLDHCVIVPETDGGAIASGMHFHVAADEGRASLNKFLVGFGKGIGKVAFNVQLGRHPVLDLNGNDNVRLHHL